MSAQRLSLPITLLITLAVATAGCGNDSTSAAGGNGGSAGSGGSGGAPALSCTEAASTSVRDCIRSVNLAWEDCYSDGDGPCASDDSNVAAALSALEASVRASCLDDEFGALSVDALVGRLQNSCSSEANSLAWRTFGGPQGATWPDASEDARACLQGAHAAASTMVDDSLSVIGDCLTGDSCEAAAVDAERQALVDTAVSAIEAACTNPTLSPLIGLTPETYVDRAVKQVDCTTATSHVATSPLTLSCGPSNAEFDPPRGEYMQVVVDGEKWGTVCGDGTDYAFQVRLAPEGERIDRIVIGLEGGGVCLLEDDCTSRIQSAPQLFNALDNGPPQNASGIASDDPEVSPFANWTKVFLPYCNQDVFAGGGVVEALGELDLPRYGSVNMRAAVQMVRDVIWKMMDAEGGDGFRPDEVVTLFGGWSAGGYGALYNYHWFLDDLQWPRTAAFPDAGGALDNGELFGVRSLGQLKIPAWGMLANLPPYCFVGDCAVGPVLYEAIAPRLKQVPEQQMLILSNPKDNTQQGDAFFDDEAVWINTMRQSYCDTKDLNGIHYYYTSVSDESIHVVSIRETLWEGSVDGEVMSDWFWHAVSEPDTLQSRVE